MVSFFFMRNSSWYVLSSRIAKQEEAQKGRKRNTRMLINNDLFNIYVCQPCGQHVVAVMSYYTSGSWMSFMYGIQGQENREFKRYLTEWLLLSAWLLNCIKLNLSAVADPMLHYCSDEWPGDDALPQCLLILMDQRSQRSNFTSITDDECRQYTLLYKLLMASIHSNTHYYTALSCQSRSQEL